MEQIPTEQQVQNYIDIHHLMGSRIFTIAMVVARIRNFHFGEKHVPEDCYEHTWEIDGPLIGAQFYSCDDSSLTQLHFPVSYLWTENFEALEQEQEEIRRANAEARRLEKIRQNQLERDKDDYTIFLRLKEKFQNMPDHGIRVKPNEESK